jgi:hypothetical protein
MAGYEGGDGKWSVTGWVRNATDEFVYSNNIITAPLYGSVRDKVRCCPRARRPALGSTSTAGRGRRALRIGDVRVHHVEEWQGNFLPPSVFFVGYDEAQFRSFASGLTPQYYRDDADSIYAFLQSWILEVDGLTLLYDTGAGNAKERPGIPLFGGLDTPFLTRMAAAGFAPEDIDIVICSHLHIDHVGWNTQLHAGRWVPTFPNARYLF